MKMLTIICRDALEADVRRLLAELNVKGYTVASGLGGRDRRGPSRSMPGRIGTSRSCSPSRIRRYRRWPMR